jgi:hypothetical protein
LRAINPGDYLHAVFATLDATAQSFPRVEREHVLSWLYLAFHDPLGHEAREYRRVVGEGLATLRAVKRFLL